MKAIQTLPSAMAIGILLLSNYAYANDKLIPIEQLTDYPLELLTEFKESKELCKGAQYGVVEYESPLSAKPGYITKADVTGDGINDYIVNTERLACEYGASIWGNFPSFNVYQGLANKKAKIIYSSTSFNASDEIYPRVVSNEQGFFDIQEIGSGGECGQEGNFSFASMEACEITQHWNKRIQDMETKSIKVLSFE